ncbi:MAG TPA: hypothetical protein VG271_19395 [Beijerinckiaceae bacterium]|nr:hypothetical protein [Beijerinckiaceae bacterium]
MLNNIACRYETLQSKEVSQVAVMDSTKQNQGAALILARGDRVTLGLGIGDPKDAMMSASGGSENAN